MRTIAIVFAILVLSATAKVLLRTNPGIAITIFLVSGIIFWLVYRNK
jgi:hypothetical protein